MFIERVVPEKIIIKRNKMEDTWCLEMKSRPGRAEISLPINIFITNSRE